MKRSYLTIIVIMFIITACTSSIQTPITMTVTYALSPLPTPTITQTPIPSMPQINIDGLSIPDPKVSNPELFNTNNPNSPIVQFANAFGVKVEDEGDLTLKLLTGLDEKQYAVLLNSQGYPLIILDNDELFWKRGFKNFTRTVNLPIGIYLEPGRNDDLSNQAAKENFDDIVLPIFWSGIFPTSDRGSFSLPDSILDIAGPKMGQFGGALLWQNPDFLPNWFKNSNITEEQVRLMIRSIIQKYPNVKVWIPINEPYSSDFFAVRLGYPQYLVIAFDEARKDTTAKLILNDFDIEEIGSVKYNKTTALIKILEKKNLIDGIGIQMHIDPNNPPSKEALIENFKSWGIDVYLTELDAPTKDEELKARIFSDVFAAAIESKVVKQINIWGLGNAAWRQGGNLFDENTQPTRALFDVEKTIVEHLLSSAAP